MARCLIYFFRHLQVSMDILQQSKFMRYHFLNTVFILTYNNASTNSFHKLGSLLDTQNLNGASQWRHLFATKEAHILLINLYASQSHATRKHVYRH